MAQVPWITLMGRTSRVQYYLRTTTNLIRVTMVPWGADELHLWVYLWMTIGLIKRLMDLLLPGFLQAMSRTFGFKTQFILIISRLLWTLYGCFRVVL
jgi:hypothetical protein